MTKIGSRRFRHWRTVLAVCALASIAGASLAEPAKGWLGFGFTYPRDARDDPEAGLVVLAVLPESPAAKAGLEPRDVILLLDGVPVTRHGEAAVLDFVVTIEPGREIELGILRGGERRTLELVAIELPPQYLDGWRRLVAARDRLRADEAGGG